MLIHSHTIDLPTSTGVMRTYVHRPADEGRYPAILFYSEIFQQTGPIERSAKIMAGHGYVVLVPEVFHEFNPLGAVLAYDNAGRDKGNADKAAKRVESYDSDNAAMIAWLQAQSFCTGQIGAMGFCLGGHLAFRAALQSEVMATACFYATDLHTQVIPNLPGQHSMERLADISGELMMIWGKQDPHIPSEGRAQVYSALAQAGLKFTWHEFNGQHAFMRDEGERYDPELAMQGYQLALGLFRRAFC
ncbi:dienelactone hydrolase family protein [Chitinimonas sp. BJB300]|uniref:dienelactone hydrolase family protein n=1 Tax=Chitinimonas sp. BJB300 TaxID=1559339 RepID=UPI000C0DB24A|nr:dienelactone hydrolase family protein [Chitinimonas sp. BJB300]PHV10738.1 dienelactone hydrolase [Chitinimonas sp. BJB300]TSJ91239.1 dienelactone hydrolase family protein [Chitinimonas sp. BJB300]